MIDWKKKLTSRKFWLAVALFTSGVFTAAGREEQGKTVYGLIMQAAAVVAYIIGEGLADYGNGTIEVHGDIQESAVEPVDKMGE